MQHLPLFVEGSDPPGTQPVEVVECSDGVFEVLCSPGFVEGIAAGDRIELLDPESGQFRVVARGGNISLKLATREPIADILPAANEILFEIEARFDGSIEHAAVWTVSASVGFPAIEAAMNKIVNLSSGSDWWYGNVYDEDGTPLGWWDDA